MITNIRIFFIKLKRAIDFFKVGWNSYDFDHSYLLELELFKMKRILKCIENGFCDWESTDGGKAIKALKLAIKIGERMLEGDYYKFHKLHHKKWGKREVNWDAPGNKLIWNREVSEEELVELKEAFRKDDRMADRDYKIFYGILAKYSRCWWD